MRNISAYFLVGGLFWTTLAFGQTDSTRYYINKLNWHCFEESVSYLPRLYTGEAIEKLLLIKDEKKIDLLIRSLKDTNKTVAAHIVLTKIFDPSYNSFEESIGPENSSTSITYAYNGLQWMRDYEKGRTDGRINVKEIESIINYWGNRALKKISSL